MITAKLAAKLIPPNNFPDYMQYAAEACEEEGHVYIYCGPSHTAEKGCPTCRREEQEIERAKEREAKAEASEATKAKGKDKSKKHPHRNYKINTAKAGAA